MDVKKRYIGHVVDKGVQVLLIVESATLIFENISSTQLVLQQVKSSHQTAKTCRFQMYRKKKKKKSSKFELSVGIKLWKR